MTPVEELFPLANPRQLLGRETDLGTALEVLDRAAGGSCQLLLISGETGVGKTTLVRTLERPVGDIHGFFLSGKFEQQASHRPLAAFVDVLEDLAAALAKEASAKDVDWPARLSRLLGNNLATLVQLVPGMAAICGEQPQPVELDPEPARQRILTVILDTLRLVTESGRTLVIFLDDLHWGDPGSLALLREMLRQGIDRSLIIGAYRTDEPDAEYAMDALFKDQHADDGSTHARVTQLQLRAMTTFDVQAILSSKLGAKRAQCRELAAQCQAHCHGNPFRLEYFLIALYARKLLRFDEANSCWNWDADGIQHLQVSQDVIDLIRLRLEALPLHMMFVLAKAACLGTRFQIRDVAELCNLPPDEVRRWVVAASHEGLLHKHLQRAQIGGIEVSEVAVFQHDQIELAAYQLQDEASRAATHLQIGWMLADRRRRQEVLDAAGHLLRAREFLVQTNQRNAAAQIMLRASNAARRLTGWQRTYRYSKAGMELLGQSAWREHPALTFSLSRNLFEASFYADADADHEGLLATFLKEELTPAQTAELLYIRCMQLVSLGDVQRSVQTGYQALRACVPDLPPLGQITSGDLARLERKVDAAINALPEDWLHALPETNDELTRLAWNILPELVASAFLAGNLLLRGYFCLTAMNLLLEVGRIPGNYFAPSTYALYLGTTNQIGKASRISALVASQPDYPIDARLFASSNLAMVPRALHYAWPLLECVELLERGNGAAISVGTPFIGSTGLSNAVSLRLASGMPLGETASHIETYAATSRAAKSTIFQVNMEIFSAFIAALQALPEEIPASEAFRNAEESLQHMVTAQEDWVEQLRLQIAFWRKEAKLLPGLLARARDHSIVLRGMPQMVEFHFIEFYCLLHELVPCEQDLREERMQFALSVVGEAAACGPANYGHLKSLMDAEQAWQRQDERLALLLYKHAVREARLHNNLPYLGLSRERLAHLLDAGGDARDAREVLQDAADAYLRWGCRSAAAQISGVWSKTSSRISRP